MFKKNAAREHPMLIGVDQESRDFLEMLDLRSQYEMLHAEYSEAFSAAVAAVGRLDHASLVARAEAIRRSRDQIMCQIYNLKHDPISGAYTAQTVVPASVPSWWRRTLDRIKT